MSRLTLALLLLHPQEHAPVLERRYYRVSSYDPGETPVMVSIIGGDGGKRAGDTPLAPPHGPCIDPL